MVRMKEIVIIVAIAIIISVMLMTIKSFRKPMLRDEWFFELIRRNLK